MQKPTTGGDGKSTDPLVPIALLGILLVGVALYALVLRNENAELRARLAHHAPSTAPSPTVPAEPAAPAATDAGPTPPPPSNAGPARLTAADRSAIVARLASVTAPEKHVWFVYAPNDPGAVALHGDLVQAFRQAGWPVDSAAASFPLRPGVFMFAADDTPPPWVNDVLHALHDVGFEPTLGLGYRAYYEERKRANPSWNGFLLAPDQAFVLAVGPR